jgi:hypothetical protein
MTAINFPPNPVDGQVFGNYSWDDSVGAWRLLPPEVTLGLLIALGR